MPPPDPPNPDPTDPDLPDRYPTKVYDAPDRQDLVAHLETNLRVTNANLYHMIDIVCLITQTFYLVDQGGAVVNQDEQELETIFSLRRVEFFAF